MRNTSNAIWLMCDLVAKLKALCTDILCNMIKPYTEAILERDLFPVDSRAALNSLLSAKKMRRQAQWMEYITRVIINSLIQCVILLTLQCPSTIQNVDQCSDMTPVDVRILRTIFTGKYEEENGHLRDTCSIMSISGDLLDGVPKLATGNWKVMHPQFSLYSFQSGLRRRHGRSDRKNSGC
jgi:hypothetical protein